MACEHAVLIEPVTPVVYTNKRPQCKLFSLLVVALCVISFIGFVTYIKTFVYELKTEIANLKDDNQRLANKVEAMNISELQTEIAKLNKEVAKLKEEDLYLWNEAWRHSVVVAVEGWGATQARRRGREARHEMAGVKVLEMRSSEVAEAWNHTVGKWKDELEREEAEARAKVGQFQDKESAWRRVAEAAVRVRLAKAQEALRQDTPNQYRDRKVKALRQDINALYV